MRSASLLTGDRSAAEEAVREALTLAAMKWPEVSGDGAAEEYVRDQLYRVVSDAGGGRLEPDRYLNDSAGPLGFPTALARLDRRQRLVLVLRLYEGLSDAATAEVLGCSEQTVVFELGQALARLRSLAPELASAFRVELPQDFADGGATEVLT